MSDKKFICRLYFLTMPWQCGAWQSKGACMLTPYEYLMHPCLTNCLLSKSMHGTAPTHTHTKTHRPPEIIIKMWSCNATHAVCLSCWICVIQQCIKYGLHWAWTGYGWFELDLAKSTNKWLKLRQVKNKPNVTLQSKKRRLYADYCIIHRRWSSLINSRNSKARKPNVNHGIGW